MTIFCRLSTLIRIVVAAALLGVLLGCAAGAFVLHPDPGTARPVPAPQTARDLRVQPDEPGKEVGTWRRTRS